MGGSAAGRSASTLAGTFIPIGDDAEGEVDSGAGRSSKSRTPTKARDNTTRPRNLFFISFGEWMINHYLNCGTGSIPVFRERLC